MLLLASASKARQNLLINACIPHEILTSGFNEQSISESDARKLSLKLSLAKARASVCQMQIQEGWQIKSNKITAVIGCDSVFEFDGETYGKPSCNKEAIERLNRMSSKKGLLHTGHTLLFRRELDKKNTFSGVISEVVSSSITFDEMSQKEIENYVNTGEPFRCAGGFALEGIGSLYIKEINGCFSNVIGLSLPWLREAFKKAKLNLN